MFREHFSVCNLQCLAKANLLCLFSRILSIMKGLAKTLSESHYLLDNSFLKESFVKASLAMASLCGLNAGHIWSNYLTRKQLSITLKGEGFQLLNLLNPFFLLQFFYKALCSAQLKKGLFKRENIHFPVTVQFQFQLLLLCSLVCLGFQGLIA